jgi:hypothetical protein
MTLHNTVSEHRNTKIFIGILICAVLFRLAKINESLAIDELITIEKYISKGFWGILHNYQSVNNHFLNSLLARVSTLIFGRYNWAYKLPSFLLAFWAVILQFQLGRLWFDDDTALAASALLGGSFYHILYSTQLRGYCGMSTAILAALVCFSLARKENKTKYWIGLGVALVCGNLFHLFMIFPYIWLLLCGIYLYWRRWGESSARKFLVTFAGAGMTVVLFYLPRMGDMQRIYHYHSGPDFLSKLFLRFVAGYLSAGPLFTPATLVYLLFFFLGIWHFRDWPKRIGITLYFIIPIVLVKYIVRPFPLRTRFFNFLLPLFVMMVAYGIKKSLPRRFWVGVMILLLFNIPILVKYYRIKLFPSDEAIKYIQQRVRPEEWIVANGVTRLAYHYYQGSRDRLAWFHNSQGKKGQDFVNKRKNDGMWYLAAHMDDRFSDSVFSFRPKWAKEKEIQVGGRSFYFQESFRGMHPLGLTYVVYHSPRPVREH